jgi:chemotaxis methyl-accepting protein methylase
MLAPGGYLCIGHSEAIHNSSVPLRALGRTIYRMEADEGDET